MVALLEVRVREEEEEFAELAASEEVRQVLHRVAPHARNVLVRVERRWTGAQRRDERRVVGVQLAESGDSLDDVLAYFHAQFETQCQSVGIEFSESN